MVSTVTSKLGKFALEQQEKGARGEGEMHHTSKDFLFGKGEECLEFE